MKIDAKIIKDFVKKASLDGKIMNINIDFKEDGVYSRVRDASGSAMTSTKLNIKAFEEYEPIGELFIRNSKTFLAYIKTFVGIVSLDFLKPNVLKIWDKTREALIMLGSEVVCENVIRKDLPNLEWTTTFKLDKADLGRSLSDTTLVGITQVEITKETDMVIFEIGERDETDFFVNKVPTMAEGEGHVKLGDILVSLYSSLDTNIDVSIGMEQPAKFREVTTNIDFICIIAPIVMK